MENTMKKTLNDIEIELHDLARAILETDQTTAELLRNLANTVSVRAKNQQENSRAK